MEYLEVGYVEQWINKLRQDENIYIIQDLVELPLYVENMVQKNMSANQADTLLYYLNQLPCILDVKVYERTADASITYKGDRQKVLDALLVDRVKKWIYTIIM